MHFRQGFKQPKMFCEGVYMAFQCQVPVVSWIVLQHDIQFDTIWKKYINVIFLDIS
jgi:hypothetical protein